ncbi:MAG TPA: hypothetical protein VGF17_29190 [Phytomonospora sp.]
MAVVVSVDVQGAGRLARDLRAGAEHVEPLMRMVVEKSAVDLQGLTQRNASGRPGPNVITGDYRASWRVETLADGGGQVSRSVGTDRAQARRLEYGFVGPDSLGRVYDQPPYPHHGPAVDAIEPVFRDAMGKIAEKAVNW